MTWQSKLEHRFVERIPRGLEPGVLYISMEYGTAAHCCACGCGEEVVTPFTPTDWKMTFDGETVSLWPSVGNWQFACRSHYIIENGRVLRSGAWTSRQIAAEQQRDKAAKAHYYGTSEPVAETGTDRPVPDMPLQVILPPLLPPAPREGTEVQERNRKGFWASVASIFSRAD